MPTCQKHQIDSIVWPAHDYLKGFLLILFRTLVCTLWIQVFLFYWRKSLRRRLIRRMKKNQAKEISDQLWLGGRLRAELPNAEHQPQTAMVVDFNVM